MVLELIPNNRECLDFQDCPAVICFEHFSGQAGTKAGLEAATLSFAIRLDPVVWLFLSTPGGSSNRTLLAILDSAGITVDQLRDLL